MINKKTFGIVSLILIIIFIFAAGCDGAACKYTGVGCEDLVRRVVVSEDPMSCKSITVDCSNYGDKGYYDRTDGIKYQPYSNSNGCGCIAFLSEYEG